MLSNALAAGMLASAYAIVLILQLNPTLSLHPLKLGPLAFKVGLFYAAACTAIAFALLTVRGWFSRDRFSPAWISIRTISWLTAIAAGAGSAVFFANVRTFSLVLESTSTTILKVDAILL